MTPEEYAEAWHRFVYVLTDEKEKKALEKGMAAAWKKMTLEEQNKAGRIVCKTDET